MRARHVLVAGFLGVSATLAVVGAADGLGRFESGPQDDALIRSARVIDGRALGVGRLIGELGGNDLAGTPWSLAKGRGRKATVIAMTSATCPISKRYGPTLAALEKQYFVKGVRFVFVNTADAESDEQLRIGADAAGFSGPVLADREHAVARTLGARSTAEVFVLDASRTLVYRGAIDDQYGLGYSLASPKRRFLVEALEAVLAGSLPAVCATSAPGCLLENGGGGPAGAPGEITWHNRVSRIVQSNCVECHRAGGVAPFSLETYADVSRRSKMIASVVGQRIMPPWFAAAPPEGQASPWANDRSLTAQDRSDLLAWLASAKAEGDAAQAASARTFPPVWSIGEPDAIIQLPNPHPIKAEGTMPYVHVRVPTNFDADKWVRAVEVQPTSRQVVHHVLVFMIPPARRDQRPGERVRNALEDSQGFFAAYVPGNSAMSFPAGMSRPLPRGAALIFQIHYTPNGTATTDQTRLALKFADAPPEHEVRIAGISDHRLKIPPGASDHASSATLRVPADAVLMAFMPHMHLRGKSFTFEATLPDGTRRTLLEVPRFDFNWQLRYELREPVLLPKGSMIRVTGVFENSAANPANPDPTAEVRWGQQTTDEMMLGYVQYYFAGGNWAGAPALGE